jgi:hypothetical protein
MIVKLQWKPKKSPEAPFVVDVPRLSTSCVEYSGARPVLRIDEPGNTALSKEIEDESNCRPPI